MGFLLFVGLIALIYFWHANNQNAEDRIREYVDDRGWKLISIQWRADDPGVSILGSSGLGSKYREVIYEDKNGVEHRAMGTAAFMQEVQLILLDADKTHQSQNQYQEKDAQSFEHNDHPTDTHESPDDLNASEPSEAVNEDMEKVISELADKHLKQERILENRIQDLEQKNNNLERQVERLTSLLDKQKRHKPKERW